MMKSSHKPNSLIEIDPLKYGLPKRKGKEGEERGGNRRGKEEGRDGKGKRKLFSSTLLKSHEQV